VPDDRIEYTTPQRDNSIIGDDLQLRYYQWLAATDNPGRNMTETFCRWLIETGDGAVALKRIQDFPRQLFLPFDDDDRPWKTTTTLDDELKP
jgi:hypothetical protein